MLRNESKYIYNLDAYVCLEDASAEVGHECSRPLILCQWAPAANFLVFSVFLVAGEWCGREWILNGIDVNLICEADNGIWRGSSFFITIISRFSLYVHHRCLTLVAKEKFYVRCLRVDTGKFATDYDHRVLTLLYSLTCKRMGTGLQLQMLNFNSRGWQ